MLQDAIPTSVITNASVHSFSVDEKNRREQAIKNKNFYYGKSEQYLQLVTSDQDPVVINLTMPIVKKKNTLLYARKLTREFDGASASTSFLEKEYDRLNIDAFLKQADLAAELTGTALVHVGIDEETHNTKLTLFDASNFSVVAKEPSNTELEAVSLVSLDQHITGSEKSPQVTTSLRSEVWTDSFITTFKNGTKSGAVKNELGFLPFTSFKGEDVYSQYLGHAPATTIGAVNNTINNSLTQLAYMIKMQGGTPIVVTGFEGGAGITLHPGKALSVPAGAGIDVLGLNPKITETLDVIKYLEDKIFDTSFVPKVTIVGDQKSNSGKELLVRWFPLIQVFKDKTMRFEKYELDLANMILKVNGMVEINNVIIDWAEESVLPLSHDTEDLQELFNFGILTPADVKMRKDPSLTEAEAEIEVSANIAFNKQIGVTGMSPVTKPLEEG